MKIEEKIDRYLREATKGDIIKVVKTKDGLELKVKGFGPTIGVGDMVEFNDTPNVRKLGFEPESGADIIKINKNGTVTVEGNTEKRENVKKTVKLEDIS
jgi:hypothetical protein